MKLKLCNKHYKDSKNGKILPQAVPPINTTVATSEVNFDTGTMSKTDATVVIVGGIRTVATSEVNFDTGTMSKTVATSEVNFDSGKMSKTDATVVVPPTTTTVATT